MVATLERTDHAGALARLATPLAVAQLAQVAMGVTDTAFLGSLGAGALAAGGLGTTVFITVLVVLQGVLSAVSVLMARAIGAGDRAGLPGLYWAGMATTAVLAAPAMLLFGVIEPILLALHEPAELARDTGQFLSVLRWGLPGGLVALGLARAVLPALGAGHLLLWVALPAAAANAGLCWVLIHGAGPVPGFGMVGAAASTALVMTAMAVCLTALLHRRPGLRHDVRWQRPGASTLRAILALGVPVAGTAAVESGLFLAVGLLVAPLGPAPLAGQQVALNVVTVTFMIPLALAQAAHVRVAGLLGAGDNAGARRAGWVAIALGLLTEAVPAIAIALAPATVAGWYLGASSAEAQAIAAGLLSLFVFQIVDGIQCAAGGALRGYGDTRIPFWIAAAGYWVVGFPLAWMLTHAGYGALGAWAGCAVGLGAVAAVLCWRFHFLTRD